MQGTSDESQRKKLSKYKTLNLRFNLNNLWNNWKLDWHKLPNPNTVGTYINQHITDNPNISTNIRQRLINQHKKFI